MSKVTKSSFCWTDDEIQLLLESVSYCKCKCEEYKGINWETVHYREAVVQRCSVKKVFFKILQNLQENTCARISFY